MTMHPVELDDDHLLAACDVRRQRRAGPGGQHRNKVETGIVLVHRDSGVRVEATERRSQGENLSVAIARLRIQLALRLRRPRDAKTVPSQRWSSRVRGRMIRVAPAHADFAPLLAEALDVIELHDYDVPSAASHLAVSTSQLVRLLKLVPQALQQVNQRRADLGLHRLL